MRRLQWLTAGALLLAVIALFLEQEPAPGALVKLLTTIVDYVLVTVTVVEVVLDYLRAPVRRNFLRANAVPFGFAILFIILFAYNKVATASGGEFVHRGYFSVLIVRNLFLVLKVFTRLRRLSNFMREVVTHPAQTIVLSFLLVIVVGTLALMTPLAAAGTTRLGFLDSLFTATSAVCVTGLIVVDTATAFSPWGQAIIAVLIQIGGLGIMILSYFTLFVFRRSVSVEDKVLLSYMLSERDMTAIRSSVSRIIVITLCVEAAGTILLFLGFGSADLTISRRFGFAAFHAVSAFCNAGFALFSDSLEQFSGNVIVNTTVVLLIIAGGLSFAVITDVARSWRIRLKGKLKGQGAGQAVLRVNTRAVLAGTGILLLSATLIIYALEHGNTMAGFGLGRQYLAAFFQAVTLRTAGFNTINFSNLAATTYLVMIFYMFIGGAAGSTAGGIKVNTAAVIWSYVQSVRRGGEKPLLFHHEVSNSQVMNALVVLLFGLLAVMTGTLILSITEKADLLSYLFETVSAFGTVGLSTGLTPHLSAPGRVVIIGLMFVGRVGPLTILSAWSVSARRRTVDYPSAEILVG